MMLKPPLLGACRVNVICGYVYAQSASDEAACSGVPLNKVLFAGLFCPACCRDRSLGQGVLRHEMTQLRLGANWVINLPFVEHVG